MTIKITNPDAPHYGEELKAKYEQVNCFKPINDEDVVYSEDEVEIVDKDTTTVTEIKSIRLDILNNERFTVTFNSIDKATVLNVPVENLKVVARSLTRVAMEMWGRLDAEQNN